MFLRGICFSQNKEDWGHSSVVSYPVTHMCEHTHTHTHTHPKEEILKLMCSTLLYLESLGRNLFIYIFLNIKDLFRNLKHYLHWFCTYCVAHTHILLPFSQLYDVDTIILYHK
jgi:hypothetical protein